MKYAIEIGWDLNGVIAEVKMDAALDAVLERLKAQHIVFSYYREWGHGSHTNSASRMLSDDETCAALRAALHGWTPPRPREETLRRRQAYVDSWRGCGHRVEHPALDDDAGWAKMGERFA